VIQLLDRNREGIGLVPSRSAAVQGYSIILIKIVRFELELSLSSVFYRIPYIGQGYVGHGLTCFDHWSSLSPSDRGCSSGPDGFGPRFRGLRVRRVSATQPRHEAESASSADSTSREPHLAPCRRNFPRKATT
jgi:hypothetical protein